MGGRATRLRLLLAGAVAVVALAVAACGGGDGDGGGDGSTGAGGGAESGEQVVIQAAEGDFNPRQIYDQVSPGVVTVLSTFGDAGDEGPLGLGPGGQGQGSGFVLNERGEIVTNAHVVTDGQAGGGGGGGEITEAEEVFVAFADRNQVPAEIVGFDPNADVALLRIDPEGLDLTPVPVGSSSEIEVGAPVAAIGSPFGQEQSLSVGVVSATDRSINSLTNFAISGGVQTDASINPGNSGGPLLDAAGRVIGLNQQINTTSGGDEGVGFAVPIDLAKRSVEQLRSSGEVDYAFIGVTSQQLYPQLAERLEVEVENGALITQVIEGTPADEAGLRGGGEEIRFQGARSCTGGDVILSVEGERLVRESDLARIISARDPGDTVELEVLRDGRERTIEVELDARDEAPTGGDPGDCG